MLDNASCPASSVHALNLADYGVQIWVCDSLAHGGNFNWNSSADREDVLCMAMTQLFTLALEPVKHASVSGMSTKRSRVAPDIASEMM